MPDNKVQNPLETPKDPIANQEYTIDWDGLAKALTHPSDKYISLGNEYVINIDELDRRLGLENQKDSLMQEQMQSADVSFDEQGNNVFDFAFNTLPDAISTGLKLWFGSKGNSVAFLNKLNERRLLNKAEDKLNEDPKYKEQLVRQRLQAIKNGKGKPKEKTFGQDTELGVQEGILQNLQLVVGGTATDNVEKLDAIEEVAIGDLYRQGKVSKEEYNSYIKYRQDKADNVSFYRQFVAGAVNSMMIAAEIAFTGGVEGAELSTTGLKVFSKKWLKTWGTRVLKGGKASFRIFKYGATTRSIGDTIDEMEALDKEGKSPGLGDFAVSLMSNTASLYAQGWLEGASEGVLQEIKMGSVPLHKWLPKIVFTDVSDDTKRMVLRTSMKELKRLAKTVEKPELKSLYKSVLKETIQGRKDVVKAITKNIGRSLEQGLFIETSTEQITDAFQDLTTKNSHSSIIWAAIGNDRQRQEALTNLALEAAIGLFLGSGMGLRDIFTRKPLLEIKERFGSQVTDARENG